jgi:ABC-2 type transport system ATP-binding protein
MHYTVVAEDIGKKYGRAWVLDGVGLRASSGSVVALLGPNGAGKTTMVRILATLTGFDRGRATVAGFDLSAHRREVRRRISLVGQHTALDGMQTGSENLDMLGVLRGLSRGQARRRRADLLAQFELLEAADRRVDTYSGGMRRRLDLAAGLVTRPQVLFLDEPTTGLDPRSRQELWEVIKGLAHAGVTILLTTQYLEEADRLADSVILIDSGRVIAAGTPDELKARVGDARVVLQAVDDAAFDELARALAGRLSSSDRQHRRLAAPARDGAAGVRRLLDEIDPDRTRIVEFSTQHRSLDDVFLSLTGRRRGTTRTVNA